MILAARRRSSAIAALLAVSLVVLACGPASPTATTAGSPTAVPTTATSATVGPTPTTTPAATSTRAANPTPTATRTTASTPNASSPSVACVFKPATITPPSDRLTGVRVVGLPGRDVVRFEFGSGSLTPAGAPMGSLTEARPPLTEAASGRPIDLAGEHALQSVFKGMSIMNDVGQPTYTGEREIRGTDASRSLREVIIFDESEGQIGWYIGYDGPSCVTISREGDAILLAIDFLPG
jgi:hypothetical protein